MTTVFLLQSHNKLTNKSVTSTGNGLKSANAQRHAYIAPFNKSNSLGVNLEGEYVHLDAFSHKQNHIWMFLLTYNDPSCECRTEPAWIRAFINILCLWGGRGACKRSEQSTPLRQERRCSFICQTGTDHCGRAKTKIYCSQRCALITPLTDPDPETLRERRRQS